MKNIVLFGPPGSGKGTQAANIVSKFNLIHLSTGDMLRAEIAAQTKLGLEAKTLMDRGELVPDAVVIGMIDNKLNANPKAAGFIFDGFPRTVAQAEALDKLLKDRGNPIQKVLSLKVSEQELTKRILERGKSSGRADDQNEDIVKNRVAEYRTKTQPLALYYGAQEKLVEIPGEGTIDHIGDLLHYEIDQIQNGGSTGGFLHNVAEKVGNLFHSKAKEKIEAPAEKHDEILVPVDKELKKIVDPQLQIKKVTTKKAAPKKAAKKAASKATKKATAKKAAKKATPKKAAKKAIKKAAPKKVVKKAAPKKAAKKAIKKVVKKAAPKKVAKKSAPKKVAKKIAKKVVKKVAPKKAAKKVAPKKAVKKSTAKKAVKKVAPKKAAKKSIAKKVAKKAAGKKKKK